MGLFTGIRRAISQVQAHRTENKERRQQNREDRRDARLERINARNAGRNTRVETRAGARVDINSEKQETRQLMVENGMNPDDRVNNIVSTIGSTVSSVFGKKDDYGSGFDFAPMPNENGPMGILKNPMVLIGIAAFALIFIIKKK